MSKKQRKSSKQISNSLAYLVVNSSTLKGKKQQDLIPVLSDLGFNKKIIATVLQATPEAVAERLSELKAAKKTAKKSNGHSDHVNQLEAIEQTS